MLAGRSSTDRKKSAGGPKGDSADAISSSIVGRSRFPSAPSWQPRHLLCQSVRKIPDFIRLLVAAAQGPSTSLKSCRTGKRAKAQGSLDVCQAFPKNASV